MRSLVMRDLETGSEWAHLLGKAMAGKLKGRELKPLITDMVTWQRWQDAHPKTTVLDMRRKTFDYLSDFYRDRANFVLGFMNDGQAWALPMNTISKRTVGQFQLDGEPFVATFDAAGVAIFLFSSRLGEETLKFERIDTRFMRDLSTGSRWSIATGRAVVGPHKGKRLEQQIGIMSYRKAWSNFHPESKDVKLE